MFDRFVFLKASLTTCHVRYRHELCLWGTKLYVLGGGTSFSADRFEDLPTFDIAERRWAYTRTKADQQATIDNVGHHASINY